jgi:formylglycine-generating enzyme required for sulfatase activity
MRGYKFITGFILLVIALLTNQPAIAADIQQGGSSNTNMVLIKGGYYTPLFKKNGDKKKQFVQPFYIDVHAVTNEEYLQFVKANPEWRRSQVKRIFADKNYLMNWKDDLNPGGKLNPLSPVTNVSWFAAKAYCKWTGKRLPTIAEWELVASANILKGSKSIINSNNKLISWYSEKLPEHINSIMSQGKSNYGVYDMFGLIREWTYDFSDMNINGTAICGAGSADATDLRNYPAFLRYAFRSGLNANSTLENLGFRCAKNFHK